VLSGGELLFIAKMVRRKTKGGSSQLVLRLSQEDNMKDPTSRTAGGGIVEVTILRYLGYYTGNCLDSKIHMVLVPLSYWRSAHILSVVSKAVQLISNTCD